MRILTADKAREQLDALISEVASSEPIQISGEHAEAILVSADAWRGLQETLYLLSIPGMKASILEASSAPDDEFTSELDW